MSFSQRSRKRFSGVLARRNLVRARLLRANGRCCALEEAEINFEHYRCRGAPRREANTLLA